MDCLTKFSHISNPSPLTAMLIEHLPSDLQTIRSIEIVCKVPRLKGI
jgi:hypothetical protein